MGRILMALMAIVCVASVVQAAPTYVVEIGTPASEAGYGMADWGPIEPTTSGGNWGGMGAGTAPLSIDQLCRVVWEPGTGLTNIAATVTFPGNILYVDILHLDGIGDDSFAVFVDGQPWGIYDDNASTNEFWTMSRFGGQAGQTLMIVASGDAWSGHGTYGTLAIDRIEAYVPVPGALLLGGLGTAIVGWMRRRRAM